MDQKISFNKQLWIETYEKTGKIPDKYILCSQPGCSEVLHVWGTNLKIYIDKFGSFENLINNWTCRACKRKIKAQKTPEQIAFEREEKKKKKQETFKKFLSEKIANPFEGSFEGLSEEEIMKKTLAQARLTALFEAIQLIGKTAHLKKIPFESLDIDSKDILTFINSRESVYQKIILDSCKKNLPKFRI